MYSGPPAAADWSLASATLSDRRSATTTTTTVNATRPATVSGETISLLVMNLPFRVRWQDLKDLCRRACPIDRADVALEPDGRSRGFGEVHVYTESDAQLLFSMLDGLEWQNRRLTVILTGGQQQTGQSMQQQRQQHQQQGSMTAPGLARFPGGAATAAVAGSSRGSERMADSFMVPPLLSVDNHPVDAKLVFVGNLPFSMQWQDLKDFLRPAGRLQHVDVSVTAQGRSRGWGTALFQTPEEAAQAVRMFHGVEVEGRILRVRLDRLGGHPASSAANPGPRDLPPTSPLHYQAQQNLQQPLLHPLVGVQNHTRNAYHPSDPHLPAGPVYPLQKGPTSQRSPGSDFASHQPQQGPHGSQPQGSYTDWTRQIDLRFSPPKTQNQGQQQRPAKNPTSYYWPS